MRSAVASERAAPPRYTSVYFVLGPSGYVNALREGRRFTTKSGTPLESEAAVRDALDRDGEVWCERASGEDAR